MLTFTTFQFTPRYLYEGLVWQYDPMEDGLCFEYPLPECSEGHIRCINLHSDHAKGPCFARHLAQSLWENEPYYLQIDSHMRFRPNWYPKLKTKTKN